MIDPLEEKLPGKELLLTEAGEAAESDLKYVLTEPEKGKEKQREEKASGEQPATWREVKKQLWGTRGRWEWRQSWNTFTSTLMFPESHSPGGSWLHISRSASVWVQAGNREVRGELGSCERSEAHGGELSFAHRSASAQGTPDDPLEKRDHQTSPGCCF